MSCRAARAAGDVVIAPAHSRLGAPDSRPVRIRFNIDSSALHLLNRQSLLTLCSRFSLRSCIVRPILDLTSKSSLRRIRNFLLPTRSIR